MAAHERRAGGACIDFFAIFLLFLVHGSTAGATAKVPSAQRDGYHQRMKQLLHSPNASISWTVVVSDLGITGMDTSDNTTGPMPMQCVNDVHEPKALTWDDATGKNGIANLKVVGSWRVQQAAGARHQVTLVTAASGDRLQQLKAQCDAWGGPLSAVVFVALVQASATPLTGKNQEILRKAAMEVAHFVATRQRSNHSCQPSILLAYEVYSDPAATVLYPVNVLRNLARLQAYTPLVAMLDVDLLPSQSLWIRLSQPAAIADMIKQAHQRTVFIVPAFETTAVSGQRPVVQTTWAEALVSAPDKKMMVTAWQSGLVNAFHVQRFALGHRLTNYSRWMNATKDYTASYEDHCEPWLIGPRLLMPWHDSRYRGFGFNKMQHVKNLALDGFKFVVVHDGYTIHRPHETQAAQSHFMQKTNNIVPRRMTLRQHVETLYKGQAKQGKQFRAVLGPQEINCRQRLPWWQGRRTRRLVMMTGA